MNLDLFPDAPIQFSPDLLARLKAGRWVNPVTGCWTWLGSLDSGGYSHLRSGGRLLLVHRLSFLHFYGPIPAGRQIQHSCDNRTCFNPDHLSAGSALRNASDASARGRMSKKLTRAQVAEILQSPLTQTALAKRFGVSKRTISHHRCRHAGGFIELV